MYISNTLEVFSKRTRGFPRSRGPVPSLFWHTFRQSPYNSHEAAGMCFLYEYSNLKRQKKNVQTIRSSATNSVLSEYNTLNHNRTGATVSLIPATTAVLWRTPSLIRAGVRILPFQKERQYDVFTESRQMSTKQNYVGRL